MPVTKLIFILVRNIASTIFLIMVSYSAYASTIYSVPFDYKRATPTNVYFSGRTESEINRFCKTQYHASQADVDACAHRDFEKASAELQKRASEVGNAYTSGDVELKENGQPTAGPYFFKSMASWADFRDAACYAETYALGEASSRYVEFWGCMTRITKSLTNELPSPKD
ncbi:lysozyme inhibitor LprI family protein [Paraburkholderia sp. Ac-20347]|uniref:lysozyme inhibitor LprI family protein n=1 Tax=Paraburkholderia sp. Ac-20347 TaxID=2703892 RepID=UPI00197CF504|nr:lysozyme inhibitor LprI family protein [Paraburkholderia sp. Ac-20347]MBN3812486.1 DUF1311 domain-containing protein [Paraburkholderia sp. Ac-20347]